MGQVAEAIEAKLKGAFEPLTLELVDESHLHKGHAGAPEGGESHFRARIVSELFEGLSRVDRQRRINEVLREELSGPVHAFTVQALTPGEA